MTFPEFVRWACTELGVGLRDGAGTKLAAKATGASDRQIRRWMDGGKPKTYAEAGVRVILRGAVVRRRKRLDPEPLEHLP